MEPGGGTVGNAGAHTITVLRENIPYVKGVTNYYNAEGGADLEHIESLKSRATSVFKNLNRAVTAEDYEWLALEASTSVARSKCLSKSGDAGEVILVVVPRPESSRFDLAEKLVPSPELLRRVKEFLDVRKLIGTKRSPIGERTLLDFSGDSRFPDVPYAAPFVDILANLIRAATGALAHSTAKTRTANISRVFLADLSML